VVKRYFRSYIVWIPFQIFFPRTIPVGGGFPFPGGWLLGTLLLVNLLAAHAVRFRFTPKDLIALPAFVLGYVLLTTWENHTLEPRKATLLLYGGSFILGASVVMLVVFHERRGGILVIHAGLIVLMASEWVAGTFQVEGHMTIVEGKSSNFVDHQNSTELAV